MFKFQKKNRLHIQKQQQQQKLFLSLLTTHFH